MNPVKNFYHLYKKHLPDVIMVIFIFGFVYAAQYIPYLNIFILNFDPITTAVVVLWILFYLIVTPSMNKIIVWGMIIFVSSSFFSAILYQVKVAEAFASLTYSMLCTVIIIKIFELRRDLKTNKNS